MDAAPSAEAGRAQQKELSTQTSLLFMRLELRSRFWAFIPEASMYSELMPLRESQAVAGLGLTGVAMTDVACNGNGAVAVTFLAAVLPRTPWGGAEVCGLGWFGLIR